MRLIPTIFVGGKIPWIELDKEAVADSTFCIEYLIDRFRVKLDNNLSEDKALARCMWKMIEENTFWAGMAQKHIINHLDGFMELCKAPFLMVLFIKWILVRRLKKVMHGHGIGRYSQEEIRHIGELDLKAISTILERSRIF
ncbi:Failed axon connections-like protein [Trichoplax sp. H2]|nr:Failed axon connections-like protein [Trichoplax sp. H2]|eukprot:RDD46514.1 Failed axon connections-like protein [Trichoplax sp. H2]